MGCCGKPKSAPAGKPANALVHAETSGSPAAGKAAAKAPVAQSGTAPSKSVTDVQCPPVTSKPKVTLTIDLMANHTGFKHIFDAGKREYIQNMEPAIGADEEAIQAQHETVLKDPCFQPHLDKFVQEAADSIFSQCKHYLLDELDRDANLTPEQKKWCEENKATWDKKKQDRIREWSVAEAKPRVSEWFRSLGIKSCTSSQHALPVIPNAHSPRVGGGFTSPRMVWKWTTPEVKGEMITIKADQLYLILQSPQQAPPGGKQTVHAFNATMDKQIVLNAKFSNEASVEPLNADVTPDADGGFTVVTLPGETRPYVKGIFPKGITRISASELVSEPDDLEALRNRADKADRRIDEDIETIVQRASTSIPQIGPLYRQTAPEEDTVLLGKLVSYCTSNNIPFVDPFFKPRAASLGGLQPRAWLRPSAYLPDGHCGKLFENKIDPNDIDQGSLGDCWFLCAVAAITEFPDKLVEPIFEHVGGKDQAAKENSVGAYRVNLCIDGWWRSIIVDNYLPCAGKVPCFAKNREEPRELWVALLEKAYAKVHGSYNALTLGDPSDAMGDLTGYAVTHIDEDDEDEPRDEEAIWNEILENDQDGALIFLKTPGIDVSDMETQNEEVEAFARKYTEVGLTPGHAYTVIAAKEVDEFRLLKIRNPWGNATEWTGDWSDRSPLWDQYPHVARECKHSIKEAAGDGISWMSFKDAMAWFKGAGICHVPRNPKTCRDIRWSGALHEKSGLLSVVLKLEITVPVSGACFTAYQKSGRGMGPNDPNRKMAAIRVMVAEPSKEGNPAMMDILAYSNPFVYEEGKIDGKFMAVRDVSARVPDLQPGTYYVVAQGNPDEEDPDCRTKSLILAMQCPTKCGKVTSLKPTEAMYESVGYAFLWNFLKDDPEPYTVNSMQVDRKDTSPVSTLEI